MRNLCQIPDFNLSGHIGYSEQTTLGLKRIMAVNFTQTAVSSEVFPPNRVAALKQVLATLNVESCPYSYNFHLHTIHSDGQMRPESIIEQAIAVGLKGLAITDHHSVEGYLVACNWLANWQQTHGTEQGVPILWSGVEINADLLGVEVHILGYGFDPTHPALQVYLQQQSVRGEDAYQCRTVIATLHQAGGLAVLAHPVRYRRSPDELIAEAARLGIDGVETYYAYANPNPWYASPRETQMVQELAATYHLMNTCGTDSHGLSILRRI